MFKKKPKVVEKKPAPKKVEHVAVVKDDGEALDLLRELDKEAGAFMAMGSMGTTATHLIEKIRSYLNSHG